MKIKAAPNRLGAYLRSFLSNVQRLLASLFGYDIFISYRRADGSEFAKTLERELGTRFAVFRDETHIEVGEEFPILLKRRIARCRIFLIVVTHGALEANSWVLRETKIRLKAARNRRFGLFRRSARIVPIFFQSISPQDIQGNSEAVSAIRISNGITINPEEARYADRVIDEVSRTLGLVSLRRFVAGGTTTFACLLALAAATMLISSSDAFVWKRINRPPVDSDYYERFLLPVHDFVVSRRNPNTVLYFARNSLWNNKEWNKEEFISRQEADGREYVVFSNTKEGRLFVQRLNGEFNELKLWKKLGIDKNWASHNDSASSKKVTWELPLNLELTKKLQTDFPAVEDPSALASALKPVYLRSGSADLTLLTKKIPGRRLDALRISWWEPVQGHYMGNETKVSWVIRFNEESEWQLVEELSALDVWPLNNTRKSALLLTSVSGFFRTDNGGVDWAQANYNETGFTQGSNVRTIIVDGGKTIYALIVRGKTVKDKPNPLFRLERRSLLDRFRLGLAKIIGRVEERRGHVRRKE